MTKDTEDTAAAVQQDYHVKLEPSEYQQELERRRLADANERAQFDRTQRALHEGKIHRRTKELVDALALPTFDLPTGYASNIVEATRRHLHEQLYAAAEAKAEAEEFQRKATKDDTIVEAGRERRLDFSDFQHAAYRIARAETDMERAHAAYLELASKVLTPEGRQKLQEANEQLADYDEAFETGILVPEVAEWEEAWKRVVEIRRRVIEKIQEARTRHNRGRDTLRYALGAEFGLRRAGLSRHNTSSTAHAFSQIAQRTLRNLDLRKLELADWTPWG